MYVYARGGREKYTYEQNMGDELYYQNKKDTFHEVYIGFMCKGAHVLREYKYKHVSPTLND